MKKRRIAIASFLMLAVLVMGIGFAAIADTLFIQGTANIVNADEVLGQKDAAIKFKEVISQDPPVSAAEGAVTLLAKLNETDEDKAVFDLTINLIKDRTEPYYAEAVYKVVYETANTTLDDVYLYPIVTVSNDPAGLTVTAEPVDENGDPASNKLVRNGEMLIKVVATYDPTEEGAGVTITESIEVRLDYEDAERQ